MGRHTGKSDFEDWCEMHNKPSEIVEKAEIYLGGAKVDIKNEKDLIPYYTHLIASMSCCSGEQHINLARESFIDSEEQDRMGWRISDLITAARKAKKDKVEFNFEYFKNSKFYNDMSPDWIWKAYIERIQKNPDVIKTHIPKDYRESERFMSHWLIPEYFYGIHDPMHNREREEFVKFAHENGYAILTNLESAEVDKVERTEGTYHPIINSMCLDILDYYEMKKEWDK